MNRILDVVFGCMPCAVGLAATMLCLGVTAAPAAVLRVGTYKGQAGDYTSIQAAVNAAKPGDWVLIAPGDYHERGDYPDAGVVSEAGAGVMIRTPNLHLRGLDRNTVIIDGTKPGSAACAATPEAQDPGPLDAGMQPVGRNGVVVHQVDGVTIENLTVCNFLTNGGGGNEIWFNGGDGTGMVGMNEFTGRYLTATTTYFGGANGPYGSRGGGLHAEYGIFVSNAGGPGLIDHTYASNMADASYYVGACPDCNTVLRHAHAQNSALGYSGTNSGGHLILERSEWDSNKTGISMNSQNNDDAPSPQDGACPDDDRGPTHTHSCTVIRNNYIHDNNNPNVPSGGTAALGPPGTGIVIAGGRNDTVTRNKFVNNGSWGVLVVPYPDTGTPPPIAHCEGGTPIGTICFYDSWGHEITRNLFKKNGSFGNETNGDIAELSSAHDPGSCWHNDKHVGGAVTSAPADLEKTHRKCGVPNEGAPILSGPLYDQVVCATEVFGACADAPGKQYPRVSTVALAPLTEQPTMPNPCRGVPRNPWCR